MSETKRIQYIHWDGSRWQAELEDLTLQSETSWNDPKFVHYREDGSYSHMDHRIGYITSDGSHWSSKFHSHSRVPQGGAHFTFEHFRTTNPSDADHEDTTMIFRGWDGNHYKVWVNHVSGGINPPIPMMFQIERV